MTDAMKSIQDHLTAIREEGRLEGLAAGYAQGFDKGFAAAMKMVADFAEGARPPARDGDPRVGDLFAEAAAPTERKRRKRGENNEVIISALNRAGTAMGASDLRRVIKSMDGVDIPYSSIRHSLMGLERQGQVTVENDMWSTTRDLEPI